MDDDVQKVLKALDEVVAEVGEDFVYKRHNQVPASRCLYVYNGQPDCIAARVLHKLGVPLEYLAHREGYTANMLSTTYTGLTQKALDVLNVAQMAQDKREPWGIARILAKAEAANPTRINKPNWYNI